MRNRSTGSACQLLGLACSMSTVCMTLSAPPKARVEPPSADSQGVPQAQALHTRLRRAGTEQRRPARTRRHPESPLGLCSKNGDGYEHCTHQGTPQPRVRFVTKEDGTTRILWIEIGVNESPNWKASHELSLRLWTAGQRGEGYTPRVKVAAFNRELVRNLDRTSRVMWVGHERRANYLGACGLPRAGANAHAAKPERHGDGSHSKERKKDPHREGHGRA